MPYATTSVRSNTDQNRENQIFMRHPILQVLNGQSLVEGALELEHRGDAVSARRLPKWTRSQVPEGMDVMVRMPSSVRLQFQTDSTSVGVEFLSTLMMGSRPACWNLQIEDEVFANRSSEGNHIVSDPSNPRGFRVERGKVSTLWFEDLPPGPKKCELWWPHNCFVELHAIHLDHDSVLSKPDEEKRTKWLHYGSSISHCMEAEEPAKTWPAVAARICGVSLQNLGFGGQCHLDQFVARTIRDQDADLISLKVGINIVNADSMKERVFMPAVHGFLDTIREGHPTTPVTVISPIFCPSAEDRPGPTIPGGDGRFKTVEADARLRYGSMSLSRVREILADIVEVRRRTGDTRIQYFNGLELFGEDDRADLPDDLHPNPVGYIRMGQRFAEKHLRSLIEGTN